MIRPNAESQTYSDAPLRAGLVTMLGCRDTDTTTAEAAPCPMPTNVQRIYWRRGSSDVGARCACRRISCQGPVEEQSSGASTSLVRHDVLCTETL